MEKIYYTLLIICIGIPFGCIHSNKVERKNSQRKDELLSITNKEKTGELLIDTASCEIVAVKYCDSIDRNLKYFNVKKLDVFGSSSEGGEIHLYNKDLDTVKIKAIYYGESGKSEYSIYFKNKQLFMFNERLTYYKYPIGKGKTVNDSIVDNSYVLKNSKVLIGKNSKQKIIPGDYAEKTKEIKELYKEIISQLE